MKRYIWAVVALTGAGAWPACSKDNDTVGIGAEGGEVAAPDGRVRVKIAAGALDERTNIKITAVDPAETGISIDSIEISHAYRLEPEDTVFQIPAELYIRTDEAIDLSAEVVEAGMLLALLSSNGALIAPDGLIQDADGSGTIQLTGSIDRLGTLLVSKPINGGVTFSATSPQTQVCVGDETTITFRVFKAAVSDLAVAEVTLSAHPRGSSGPLESPQLVEGEPLGTMAAGEQFSVAVPYLVRCQRPGRDTVFARLRFFGYALGEAGGDSFLIDLKSSDPNEDPMDLVSVECVDCGSQITPGVYASVMAIEAATVLAASLFDILPGVGPGAIPAFEDDTYIAVAGADGHAVHRLSDGMMVHDLRFAGAPSYAAAGANNSLVSVGPDGYSDRRYNATTQMFGFAQLGLFGQNITDAAPIPGAIRGVHGVLLANNSFNQIERLDPVIDMFGGFTLAAPILAGGVTGQVVSLWSPPGEGPILFVTNDNTPGAPGELFWVDPANPGGQVFVGPLPEGPRRIRCLEPAGSICAVSSYVAGAITLIDWPSRAAPPTIGPTTVPVAGPVGIDLALVGGMPTVASTGFVDDTLHLTTIGAGLVPSDQSTPLPNCADPGHVIFVPGETHVVVTCNGAGAFEVVALP